MEQKIYSAKLDQLHKILSFIQSYCNTRQISNGVIEQVILAAEEALVNVISYGYPNDENGWIEITCEETKRPGILMIFKDRGIPFNPLENVPSEMHPENSFIEKKSDVLGGYGIYLLSRIMDEVEYQRFNDENILKLVKYF